MERDNTGVMPYIDYSLCTGCGACAEVYPQFFEMRDGKAWVIDHERFEREGDRAVVKICTFGAISVE